jgi:hypothetical protein
MRDNPASLVRLDEAHSGAVGGRRTQGYGARTRISELSKLRWWLRQFSKGATGLIQKGPVSFSRNLSGSKGASTRLDIRTKRELCSLFVQDRGDCHGPCRYRRGSRISVTHPVPGHGGRLGRGAGRSVRRCHRYSQPGRLSTIVRLRRLRNRLSIRPSLRTKR